MEAMKALLKSSYAPKIRVVFEPTTGKVNVKRLADVLDVSVRKLAPGVGVTEGAIRQKPTADRAQPGARKMVDVFQHALDVIGDWTDTMVWMQTPRKDLSGNSPLTLIVSGRAEVVSDLIENIESGQSN